jgi:long-chain-fatty-acid--[acyl-carrier-protein] ligase
MKLVLIKGLLWLRYFIWRRGLKKSLSSLDKRPVLFLFNCTSQIDPLIALLSIPRRFRPLLVLPRGLLPFEGLSSLMSSLGTLFVPHYTGRLSSIGQRRAQRQIKALKMRLKEGRNLLLLPSGKADASSHVALKESTLVSDLLKEGEDVQLVLVRIDGMLGSSFSTKPPSGKRMRNLKDLLLCLLKNGLFFSPRRKVVVTFASLSKEKMAADLNSSVEELFNQMDASLGVRYLPYHYWSSKEPVASVPGEIPEELRREVCVKLGRVAHLPPDSIDSGMTLYEDLGLDSLDVTELVVWIEQRFHFDVNFDKLRTVQNVFEAAYSNAPRLTTARAGFGERWGNIEARDPAGELLGKTIGEAFLRRCDLMKSEIASVDPQLFLSYIRLKSLVLGLAEELKALPGQRVGVLMPSTAYLNAFVLALLLAKKTPVMLNWTLGSSHLEEAVRLAEVEVILSQERFLEGLKVEMSEECEEKIQTMEDVRGRLTFKKRQKALLLARKNADELLAHFDLTTMQKEEMALLLFTSGTEKTPKGVPLSHHNLLSNQRSGLERIDMTSRDVVLGMLPAFHIFGLSATNLMPLLAGVRVVFAPNFLDLAAVALEIEKWGVTILFGTPTLIKALLAIAKKEQLQSVRLFVLGAEAAPAALFAQIEELGTSAQAIEGYGLTECSPILTLNRLYEPHRGVGPPLASVELAIIDPESHKRLNQGQVGLIIARGPSVFKGYLNAKERPFVQLDGNEWFITGDIGFLDAEGALFLQGRISRTVKTGGEMISLGVIEQALLEELGKQGAVIKLALLSKESEEGGLFLVLFSTLPLEVQEVNALVRSAGLSNLMRIKQVIHLPELPLLATGKINYRALEKLL